MRSVIGNLSDVLGAEATSLGKGNLTLSAIATSVIWKGTEVPYYTDILRSLTLTTSVQIGDIFKNTMRYLDQHSSMSSEFSSLLASRSEDKVRDRDPVDLAVYMKQSTYIRDLFQDVDPRKRDTMIDSIAAMYPVFS